MRQLFHQRGIMVYFVRKLDGMMALPLQALEHSLVMLGRLQLCLRNVQLVMLSDAQEALQLILFLCACQLHDPACCRLQRLQGLNLCVSLMKLLMGKGAQLRCTTGEGRASIRASPGHNRNTTTLQSFAYCAKLEDMPLLLLQDSGYDIVVLGLLLIHIRQRFLYPFALIHHLMLLPIQVAGYDLVMLGLLQLQLGNVQLITLSYRQQALYKISFIGFLFADKIHHRARCLLHRLESLDLCMRFTCLLVGKAM
mmetsp:Transcript_142575/g.355382  ORF Transcript_142575/g.355382 Transcript_142575/m.355382 type:complete len:253 (+) Transcript_142575:1148-1906(+)